MEGLSVEALREQGHAATEQLLTAWAFVRSLSLLELVLMLSFAVLFRFVLVSIYRLTLHPLAKYPGSFWNKISDWPLVYACYKGNRHIREFIDHEKYGPVVRYTPNSLSFSSPTALQTIHGAKANIKKGDFYLTLDISAGAPSVQMVRDKQEHAIRRKFISPAFSERALKDSERLINKNAVMLCDRLKLEASVPDFGEMSDSKGWSNPINFSDWATYYGFDFISDLSFGMSFNMLEDRETRYIPGVLKNASQYIYYVGYLPFIDWYRPFVGSSIQDYIGGQPARDALKFTALANQRLADRMAAEDSLRKAGVADPTVRKDVFHYLLNSNASENGRKFSTEELQADASLLIAAGSDGVGITVAAAMFYLLSNPSTLTRLIAEIRSSFTDPSEICNPKLSSLPYLHACIEETLRLNPPKASTLPREVLKGGMDIDGHHIPQGTNVGVPAYTLHHDASIFPNPWSYLPERWIVDAATGVTAQSVARARSAFLPFLIGPMNCIGKNMAYIATKLALCHLLWRFDVRQSGPVLTGGGGPDLEEGRKRPQEYQMADWILAFRDGPLIELRERV